MVASITLYPVKKRQKKYISQKQKNKKLDHDFLTKEFWTKWFVDMKKKRERKKIKIPRSGFDNWKWFCTVRKKTGSPFYNLYPLECV